MDHLMQDEAIDSVHRNILESDMDIDQAFDQFVFDWGVAFTTGELMSVWEDALATLPELN
jgi:hypothetical protein